jgi:hypothetical protein
MALDGNAIISLVLNLDKTNVILGALSTQPYDKVALLITEIQQQATNQLRASTLVETDKAAE